MDIDLQLCSFHVSWIRPSVTARRGDVHQWIPHGTTEIFRMHLDSKEPQTNKSGAKQELLSGDT